MRRSTLVAMATFSFFGASQALAAEPCDRAQSVAASEIVSTIEAPPPATPDRAPSRETVVARTAAACSYNFSATRLFERLNTRRSTPIARFNLATVYARTGRIAEARALYQSAADDGAFQWVTLDPKYDSPESRQFKVNVADEARRRIANLDAYSSASSAKPAAPAAAENAANAVAAPDAASAGVDASATAPGVFNLAQSDQGALALDGLR